MIERAKQGLLRYSPRTVILGDGVPGPQGTPKILRLLAITLITCGINVLTEDFTNQDARFGTARLNSAHLLRQQVVDRSLSHMSDNFHPWPWL